MHDVSVASDMRKRIPHSLRQHLDTFTASWNNQMSTENGMNGHMMKATAHPQGVVGVQGGIVEGCRRVCSQPYIDSPRSQQLNSSPTSSSHPKSPLNREKSKISSTKSSLSANNDEEQRDQFLKFCSSLSQSSFSTDSLVPILILVDDWLASCLHLISYLINTFLLYLSLQFYVPFSL
jgi:hypothetical protein